MSNSGFLNSIFPMSEYWSWGTFILYCFTGIIVMAFCKSGARAKINGMNVFDVNFRYFAAYVILVLLATLRTEYVGSDTHNYVNYFRNAAEIHFDWDRLLTFKQMEPGFQYYLYFVRKLTSNYTVFFLITYSIVAYGYIAFIKYYLTDLNNISFLWLFIFFYVSNMSGMRSALGTFLLLYSFIALEKNKFLKALIFTVAACFFHYTMIFNLLIIAAYTVLSKKIFSPSRVFWIIAVTASAVFSSAGSFFLKGIFAETKYSYYSSVSTDEISLLGSIFYVVYFVICIIFYEKLMKERKTLTVITLSLMVAYPLLLVTGAYRIPNYYALPRLVIWCKASDCLTEKQEDNQSRSFIKLSFGIIAILYLLFKFTRSAEDGFFEYTFVSF